MATMTEEVTRMFSELPEKEQTLIFELVIRLFPDDVATDIDRADIRLAHEEYARGEAIPLDAVINQ